MPPAPPDTPTSERRARPGTALFTALEGIGWARRTLDDLTRGDEGQDLERLEHHFARSLRTFREVDAALRAAAGEAGTAADGWLAAHQETTASDPLLRYLLNAPDLDPEDPDQPTLLTWAPDIQSFEMTVADPRRASRFFDEGALVRHLFRCETDAQLFRKVADGVMPSLRRLHKAGVTMTSRYETLHLRGYARDGASVPPPADHAGQPLAPSAAAALAAAVAWFETAGRALEAVAA